jgi:hypothetical protein
MKTNFVVGELMMMLFDAAGPVAAVDQITCDASTSSPAAVRCVSQVNCRLLP